MTNKVLLLTNKDDITTDFIVKKLREKRIDFYRINTEEIGVSLQIVLNIGLGNYSLFEVNSGLEINLLSFDAVYFRRPEVMVNTEKLTPGEANFVRGEFAYLLEGLYKILAEKRWLNTVDAIRIAENKVHQLLTAKKIGFSIPESLITNRPDAARCFSDEKGELIIKPLKSGLVEAGVEEGVIFTSKIRIDDSNAHRINALPVFLQSHIKKKADVRVTVVGKRVFAALIHSQVSEEAIVDWRRSEKPLAYEQIELPEEISNKCIQIAVELGLNFGAIDLIQCLDDSFLFLEINPNGQWAWIEKQLNYPISDEIVSYLA